MRGDAKEIVRAAHVLLQDEGTRWPAGELVAWLNEAQRLLVAARPEVTATTMSYTPTPGARQTLPDDAAKLLEVRCNTDGKMRAMTRVDGYVLESVDRDWASSAPKDVLLHYMPSATEPRVFYVYPPASTNAKVEMTYSKYPEALPEPSGARYTDVSGDTSVDIGWNGVLLDYVMYRAWLKDAEYGSNPAAAAGFLSTFTAAISVGAKS